jgi:hypothetical protein
MKQKVPQLQVQMRERGLKPGRKRKSELVAALVADEVGHDSRQPEPRAKPTTPSSRQDFGARAEGAATGEDALLAAPLSLTRPDTHAKPGGGQGLTTDQRYALLDYQGAEYVKINGRLRDLAEGKEDTTKGDAAELTADLDDAMANSPLARDAVVYRGIRASRKVFGDRVDGNLTGMEWLETGFVSTSAVESVVAHFSGAHTDPVRMRVLAPKGTHAIQVSDVQGRDGVADEAELLLDRNTRMRVAADRGVVDGVRHLDVEVVT